MLLEEFEKKTNIFVPGEYFDLIHQFYMNTEMDKDQFCKGSRVVSKRKEVLWGFFFFNFSSNPQTLSCILSGTGNRSTC